MNSTNNNSRKSRQQQQQMHQHQPMRLQQNRGKTQNLVIIFKRQASLLDLHNYLLKKIDLNREHTFKLQR